MMHRIVVHSVSAATLVLLGACSGAADLAPVQQCAVPNVLARVVSAALPIEPPIAAQQGVTGVVTVLVGLNARSEVVATIVSASPSTLLDAAALAAAKNSTYQTAIANCIPVSATLEVAFRFPGVTLPAPAP